MWPIPEIENYILVHFAKTLHINLFISRVMLIKALKGKKKNANSISERGTRCTFASTLFI